MKFRTWTCTIAMTLFVALAVPVRLVAQDAQVHQPKHTRYSIKVLPTLGGTDGEAWGINNKGLVTGISTTTGHAALDAFLWRKGLITDLGSLGGPISLTFIRSNERGEVAGYSNTTTLDPNGEDFCNGIGTHLICLPFVWQNAVMTTLPTLGGTNGQAAGINNRGQIVGVAETQVKSDPCSFAFLQVEAVLWDEGNIYELPPFPGDDIGSASAINDRGQVVGATGCIATNTIRAVLWPDGPNGGVIDLGNLGGTGFDVAFDINNRGQVVGQSNLRGEKLHHGFLWQNGTMTDLGSLAGLSTSLANAINNQGQVVGFSQDENGDDDSSVAWIWRNGVMTDLNTLIPPGFPLYLKEALSINDRGQIAGYGVLSSGEHRGFLLTPCNEDNDSCEDNAAAASIPASATIRRAPASADNLTLRRKMLRSFSGRWMPWYRSGAAPTEPNAGVSQLQKFTSNTVLTSAPIVALSPTSLTFPIQAIDTTSSAGIVALKNTGTAGLTISAITIVGINAADFAQTHSCGTSLAVGASCSISVTFKPTSSGTRTAALSISDNAAGSPQKVSLSGIGTTAKVSPTSLNFGTVAVGGTSSKTVTLTNVGTTTLTITGVAITGTTAGDFSQTHNCGSSLVPAGSCSISVTFKPTASGTRTAALSVSDNAAGSPQKVTLSGIGTTAKLYPSNVNFGSVTIDTASSPQTVTLTNVGSISLSITGIAISGTDPGDFAQTHTCGTSLAAGASCSVNVTFKPSASGTRTAGLSVTDNGGASPQIVPLSGTGVAGKCTKYGGECGTPFTPRCCAGLTCSYCGLRDCCL